MEPPPIDSPAPDQSPISEGAPTLASGTSIADSHAGDWRNELSARLSHYRSRRKAPPPRYPSLRLPFGPAAAAVKVPDFEDSPLPDLLAAPDPPAVISEAASAVHNAVSVRDVPVLPEKQPVPANVAQGAKIIEFPRFAWAPPPPPSDQLAGPVMEVPRILEVPELAPAPPALGGITIEPIVVEESHKQPGVDAPLQNAPLGQRLLALLIDGLIIGTASVLFGFVFWKVTLVRPPQIQLLTFFGTVPCLFWAAYQYLLIVYSGTTPGIHLARLHLTRFDGKPTTRALRRWRVFASYLSAASLGMGYIWLFLDEDALCWHDRITRTYLAPRKATSHKS